MTTTFNKDTELYKIYLKNFYIQKYCFLRSRSEDKCTVLDASAIFISFDSKSASTLKYPFPIVDFSRFVKSALIEKVFFCHFLR